MVFRSESFHFDASLKSKRLRSLLEKQSELFECDFSVSVSIKLLHQGRQFCLRYMLLINSKPLSSNIFYIDKNMPKKFPETLVIFPPSLLNSLWSMLPLPSLSIAWKIIFFEISLIFLNLMEKYVCWQLLSP